MKSSKPSAFDGQYIVDELKKLQNDNFLLQENDKINTEQGAETYYSLGHMFEKAYMKKEALANYLQALEIRENIQSQNNEKDAQLNLSIAIMAAALEDRQLAYKHATKSLNVRLNLYGKESKLTQQPYEFLRQNDNFNLKEGENKDNKYYNSYFRMHDYYQKKKNSSFDSTDNKNKGINGNLEPKEQFDQMGKIMWHEDDDGLSHLGFMFKDDQVFDNVNSKGEDMKW